MYYGTVHLNLMGDVFMSPPFVSSRLLCLAGLTHFDVIPYCFCRRCPSSLSPSTQQNVCAPHRRDTTLAVVSFFPLDTCGTAHPPGGDSASVTAFRWGWQAGPSRQRETSASVRNVTHWPGDDRGDGGVTCDTSSFSHGRPY